MTIKMEESNQNMGVRNPLIFRRLLVEMIELKIVKYVDRVENGRKRRYFWME